jgi:type I restriction enzyme, S subunit
VTKFPDGWRQVTIGEVLAPLEDGRTIHQGWSPRCEQGPSEDDSNWGVLKTTAIQPGHFEPHHNKRLPDSLAPRPILEVHEGDVIITSAGPRARCGVATLVRKTRPRLMLSGKMYRFRFDEELVVPRFGELYLLSDAAIRRIDSMKTGINDSGLNLTHARFRGLPFLLPPLVEQERIVTAIEESFSRLDAAEQALNSAALRTSLLARVALQAAIPREGPKTDLGSLLDRIEAGKSFRVLSRPAEDDEWGIVKVSAMTWGKFREGENKALPAERVPDSRFEIKEGDLLLSRANTREHVGASVLVGDCRPRLLLSDKSLRLVPAPSVDTSWLWRALSAPSVRARISALATGTKDGMRNISQANLRSLRLPDIDFDRQVALATEVDAALTQVAHLHDTLAAAVRRLQGLRLAVLRDAFSGRLVAQPESTIKVAP